MRTFQSITIRNNRQFKAFTGISENTFDRLLTEFTQCLNSDKKKTYRANRATRRRRPGGGRRGVLATPELKLFFILFYFKNYPTFDVLGGLFDLSASKAEENVKKLIPILKNALKNQRVLPHRHLPKPKVDPEITTKKDSEIQTVIIDATERLRQRPHHQRKQKNYYSGKRHAHTYKNTIMSDGDKGICVVGPTTAGRRHDYSLLKSELDPDHPSLPVTNISVDLGYQGIQDDYPNIHHIDIPHKKPKKSKTSNPTLTPEQKKDNRAISRTRVAVEHLIGDLKQFQILTNKFRNHAESMADQVIVIISGLANLKNNYVVQ